MRIGVISDTHGQLSPAAVKALSGVDHILHAGDIGDAGLVRALERIAPVTAVRGNMDHESWAGHLPQTEMLVLGDVCFYILHDLNTLDLDPVAAGVDVVISGHTHQPWIQTRQRVLYFNPGSASSGRYDSPESVGILRLTADGVMPRIMQLNASS